MSARRVRRTRRIAAFAILLAGLIDLASSVTPPMRGRFAELLRIVPLAVPQIATALSALAGLGLLLLARGIRRGQRRAWQAAVVLLVTSALLHAVKGVDLEEAATAALIAGYLVARRRAFTAPADHGSVRSALLVITVGGTAATLFGAFAIRLVDHHISILRALLASADRLVGSAAIPVPTRLDELLYPALLAVGCGIAVASGAMLSRPLVARVLETGAREVVRARAIVAQWGRGSLDYFALRDDKRHFFAGNTLVAYAVLGGVCLVSPDPIGPPDERENAWAQFRDYADCQGWSIAVMGASAEWLPVYRRGGMGVMYVGDEGVVDCKTFSLEGGRFKGLRQAVNRIARYGYRVEFHDPATIDSSLRHQLEDLRRDSRRGEAERGFSMTLGRIFHPHDHGLMVAVCFDKNDVPVAFCHYVPAPGIDGFSLDLMRRDRGEHPNGLTDFVVVETIRHLKAIGRKGLALNFATMRAILAGETGDGVAERIKRWMLERMSDSMQIESLWRYNAKFDPLWHPRYAVYDATENMLSAALAVARAESFSELPLLGRFLVPRHPVKAA
jgi:lysylphosphatidylglycerol synthetase-like protein (DUF2156 family)